MLVRTDRAGATHDFLDLLYRQRVSYSIGFAMTDALAAALDQVPKAVWECAVDADGQVRDGAWVIDATGLLDLTGWPEGMRVIVRKERPHPGAQLRFTDRDGLRLTAFATNTRRGQIQNLELRHRRRARCEDRIRGAKDTGLANLPLHGFDQNRIWRAIVQLALALTAWMQMLGFADHDARRLGPQTTTATGLLDRREDRHPRPPHPPQTLHRRALDRLDHHRTATTGGATPARLTMTL